MYCPSCFNREFNSIKCDFCAFPNDHCSVGVNLPIGTKLHGGEYIIGKVLGKPGGFGITYLAWNTRLEVRFAIKEFLPRQLAARAADGVKVRAHGQEEAQYFSYGMAEFLREARLLAKFNHPNIIRVHSFFKENDTAYFVMDYLDGETLDEYLHRVGKLNGPAAISLFEPILDGLAHVHQQNILHRDIKPQNIYITREKKPVILDFGAARQLLTERSQSLTALITPGFAPPEQYSQKEQKQGAWTDVYACAATLYWLVTEIFPAEAHDRLMGEVLLEPKQIAPNVSEELSVAIMAGLNLNPMLRPQTAEEFQSLLSNNKPTSRFQPVSIGSPKSILSKLIPTKNRRFFLLTIAGLAIVLFSILVLDFLSIYLAPRNVLTQENSRQSIQSYPDRQYTSSDFLHEGDRWVWMGEESNVEFLVHTSKNIEFIKTGNPYFFIDGRCVLLPVDNKLACTSLDEKRKITVDSFLEYRDDRIYVSFKSFYPDKKPLSWGPVPMRKISSTPIRK